jgi:hypothetical protein
MVRRRRFAFRSAAPNFRRSALSEAINASMSSTVGAGLIARTNLDNALSSSFYRGRR